MSDDPVMLRVDFGMSDEVRKLAHPIMRFIMNYHRDAPPSRERLQVALDAITIIAATLIIGAGPGSIDTFNEALEKHLETILAQMERAIVAQAGGKMQ